MNSVNTNERKVKQWKYDEIFTDDLRRTKFKALYNMIQGQQYLAPDILNCYAKWSVKMQKERQWYFMIISFQHFSVSEGSVSLK